MGRGTVVRAPDGARWRVRRRWVERPAPKLRRLWRQYRREASLGDAVDATWAIDSISGLWAGLALAALLLLVVFVLLPLLGIALELIAFLLLLLVGVAGRVLLGRPWIVEAVSADPEERVVYAVKGWGQSDQALRELRDSVSCTGRPQAAVGRQLTTRPASACSPY